MTDSASQDISRKDVEYIASLARVHLEDHEIERLTGNLGDILHYVKKLSGLNIDQVQPTSHVLSLENVYRDDAVKPSFEQPEALQIAVSQSDGCFKVPQVIE